MTTTALPPAGAQHPRPRRSPEGVLREIRSARAAAAAWEFQTAQLVITWIEGHQVPGHLLAREEAQGQIIGLADAVERPPVPGMQAPMQLAGAGAPMVWDLAFCELATSLTMSLDAARGYAGEVAELYFRLPQLWARVAAGEVRLWRAREVARNTSRLSFDGAAWVDAQLAAGIGSCSGAQLRRTITAALQRFDPEAAEAERAEAADGRHFSVRLDAVAEPEFPGSAGVVSVEGVLDTADALDLDAAVAGAAAHLKACGSTESQNVRRARAVGEIARREATLALPQPDAAPESESGSGPALSASSGSASAQSPSGQWRGPETSQGASSSASGAPARTGRHVELIVHLDAAALGLGTGVSGRDAGDIGAGRAGAGGSDRGGVSSGDSDIGRVSAASVGTPGMSAGGVGRCENTRSPVLAEQIRSWCGTPGTRVTVRPVIDLAGHEPTDSYEIPARLREQVMTRDPQCVFPSCTRRARRADVDHIVPFEDGGPTCGCNLAPLCRRHHRAKTHAGWTYVMVTPGTYLWTSPTAEKFLVDGHGTFRIPAIGETCAHTQQRDRALPPNLPSRPDRTDHATLLRPPESAERFATQRLSPGAPEPRASAAVSARQASDTWREQHAFPPPAGESHAGPPRRARNDLGPPPF